MTRLNCEREKAIRELDSMSALPHPLFLRDELLAEIDALRELINKEYALTNEALRECEALKNENKELFLKLKNSSEPNRFG